VFFLTHHLGGRVVSLSPPGQGLSIVIELPLTAPDPAAGESREFVTKVLMNDSLWERLLPQ
jgi:two-component system probable response regulator PhcQ